jgi:hypothetical protein
VLFDFGGRSPEIRAVLLEVDRVRHGHAPIGPGAAGGARVRSHRLRRPKPLNGLGLAQQEVRRAGSNSSPLGIFIQCKELTAIRPGSDRRYTQYTPNRELRLVPPPPGRFHDGNPAFSDAAVGASVILVSRTPARSLRSSLPVLGVAP